MDIPSRGSEEERIRIPCRYELIYRVTDIINKTELSTCKVPSYVARQRGTSGRRVGSDGGSGAVGARGEPGARLEGEREAEAEAEGVPLTISYFNARGGLFSTIPTFPCVEIQDGGPQSSTTSPPSHVSMQGRPFLPSLALKRKTEVPNPHHQPFISRFNVKGAIFNLSHLLHIETWGGGLSTLLHPHHHPQPNTCLFSLVEIIYNRYRLFYLINILFFVLKNWFQLVNDWLKLVV